MNECNQTYTHINEDLYSFSPLSYYKFGHLAKTRGHVWTAALNFSNMFKKCFTFISWLISLFTGCAGFLLRLFSGGLPFSISGIVLVPARSDPDHRCASVGASLAELWRVKAVTPGDSACHSVRSPSSGASHHLSSLNMRACRAGVSTVNNHRSFLSNTDKLLVKTTRKLPVGCLQN